ncbi:MAG: HAMP domain-containing protein [Sphingomonadaceae bacterium]|nr:HAMP domain-containing protein [Sphingomonadaceae bacterium]
MKLWPGSLRGQVLLAVMLALLVAQAVSAVLLLRAADNRRDAAMLNAAAIQLVRQDRPFDRNDRDDRRGRRERGREFVVPSGQSRWQEGPRPLRLEWTDRPAQLAGDRRDAGFERDLQRLLAVQGIAVAQTQVVVRRVGDDPWVMGRPRLADRIAREGLADRPMLVAAVRRDGASQWAIARVPRPPVERGVQRTVFVQTAILFLVLTAALWLLLRRITRPLASLTARTEQFAETRQPAPPLPESGPDDVRRLIAAHNAMEGRIGGLLEEKDVMLGAIGHDLKTPLAALRVRLESVPDAALRGRMVATIEDMTTTLDDILMLARVGRPGEAREPTDLRALAASVVSEFEDLGEAVTLAEGARLVAPVQASLLRRALRNLVGNAVRYGRTARVEVLDQRGQAVLRVDDEGPGIPPERIPEMLEPFARGEGSRNRQTGGTGLGLAIARAIAEQHGGTLVLVNRPEGGLRVEIRLPAA